MSMEGTATALLALGAGAVHVLEAGVAPLQMANNHYYLRVAEEPGDPVDQLEFRVYWHGTTNLDVAAIRIR